MTSALCWDNQGRTRVSGYYLDPEIDFPISGDVTHAFEQHPATPLLWLLEADRSALVEASAKNLHVAWPTADIDGEGCWHPIPWGSGGIACCDLLLGHAYPFHVSRISPVKHGVMGGAHLQLSFDNVLIDLVDDCTPSFEDPAAEIERTREKSEVHLQHLLALAEVDKARNPQDYP